MNFGSALANLKEGRAVTRKEWGVKVWIFIWRPDPNTQHLLPHLNLKRVDNNCFPWTPNQEDLFAEDWVVLH